MADAAENNLHIIEAQLNFLCRHVQNILTEDFESIDEADLAIRSALRSLEEYKRSHHVSIEDHPVHVALTT